jgi:hypothetical protein
MPEYADGTAPTEQSDGHERAGEND